MYNNMGKPKLLNIDSLNKSESPSITSPDDPDGVLKVGPPDIPPGMEVYGIRFSLPHDAITWENEKRFEIMELFNKKWKVYKYIWAYESKIDGSSEWNPHLHMYVICPTINKSTKSDWYKKIKHLVRLDAKGRVMIRPEAELINLERYQAYILKDGNYKTNFDESQIAYIEDLKDKIKQDIKKSVGNKLLDRVKELQEIKIKAWEESTDENKSGNPPDIGDLNTICDIIINIYIFDWDKPPPLSKIKEYGLFVGRKMGNKHAMAEKILFWN